MNLANIDIFWGGGKMGEGVQMVHISSHKISHVDKIYSSMTS